MSDLGHKYDGINLCLYCDRCPDSSCCDQVTCDQRCVPRIDAEAVIARMQENFDAYPHEGEGVQP